MLDRLTNFFLAFGPIKDSKTGNPLFNNDIWDKAYGILSDVADGLVSDHPDIPMYSIVGKDKDGLIKYRCIRGTNRVEGWHQNVMLAFGAFGAGIQFGDAVLTQYRHRHNIVAGYLNRMNKSYRGHYEPWLNEWIQYYYSKVAQHHVELPYHNALYLTPTSETFGILKLPDDVVTSLNMSKPANPPPKVISSSSYLAYRQQTKYAILPIHTVEEKQLYSSFMLGGFFNLGWKELTRKWNLKVNTVNGVNLYYKVPEQLKQYHNGVRATVSIVDKDTLTDYVILHSRPLRKAATDAKQN